MDIITIFQIIVSLVLVTLVLLQQRSAGSSGGLFGGGGGGGGDGAFYQRRRGVERILFISTIVTGTIFVVLSVVSLIL
ncbi:MAG: preprotein translocase subunit SecG [Candidatus Colwellbacteria bacterium]